jgi:hypothetical protein
LIKHECLVMRLVHSLCWDGACGWSLAHRSSILMGISERHTSREKLKADERKNSIQKKREEAILNPNALQNASRAKVRSLV